MCTVTVALVGCLGIGNVKENYELGSLAGQGLVIFSTKMLRDCPSISGTSVSYVQRGVDPGVLKDVLLVFNSVRIPQGHLGADKGYLHVKTLEPGDYSIDAAYADDGFRNYSMTDVMDIPFTVVANKAVYLGQIGVGLQECWPRPTYFKVTVEDQWERDAVLLASMFPKINPQRVEKTVMKVSPGTSSR